MKRHSLNITLGRINMWLHIWLEYLYACCIYILLEAFLTLHSYQIFQNLTKLTLDLKLFLHCKKIYFFFIDLLFHYFFLRHEIRLFSFFSSLYYSHSSFAPTHPIDFIDTHLEAFIFHSKMKRVRTMIIHLTIHVQDRCFCLVRKQSADIFQFCNPCWK